MNIVFFGTSDVALPILESLHNQHQVVQVVTTPDAMVGKKKVLTPSPVAVIADRLRLPTTKPDKVKNNQPLLDQLRDIQADVFIVVSYGKILPEEIISLPKLKTLNVHFSRLPEYRGAAPLQYALKDGKDTTATTIFILDKELDHGPILAQQKISITPDDTFITLKEKAAEISEQLLMQTLPDYASGKINPQAQDHSKATYTKIIKKEDGNIDWNKTAAQIYNQFRALIAWPGIWTTWNNQLLKITDCSPSTDTNTDKAPGTVIDRGRIICGNDTVLEIKKLQLAGKKETDIKSFLNGHPAFIGSKFSKDS
jgi:methionyl-tRNA formyltransferase